MKLFLFLACLATICFASRLDRIIEDLLEAYQSEDKTDKIKFDGGSAAPQASSVFKWTGSYYEGTQNRYLTCCKSGPFHGGEYYRLYWTMGPNKDDGCRNRIVRAHIGQFDPEHAAKGCPRDFHGLEWKIFNNDKMEPQPKIEICTADIDCDQSEDKTDKIKFDGGSAAPQASSVFKWTGSYYKGAQSRYLTCCKSGPYHGGEYYRLFWTMGSNKYDNCKNWIVRAHIGQFDPEAAAKVGCPREFLVSGDATWKIDANELQPQPKVEICTTDCDQ